MTNQRFFGHPESPLFGVYHQPRGKNAAKGVRAAIICPPIGQEYNRTHWTLRLFANQIARKGVHVLRLDYQGIGDSAQSIDQIENLETWENNIEQAIDHLKKQANAETVMLIGQRMGGALAAKVATKRPDVNGLVLWEPVLQGKEYIEKLRSMHAQMLDLWVCKMTTPNNKECEEILGSLLKRSMVEDIEQLSVDLSNVTQPQLIIDSPSRAGLYSHPEANTQFIMEDDRSTSWYELSELELAWLRPDMLRQLVKKVVDMFDRLERFNALVEMNQPTELLELEAGQ